MGSVSELYQSVILDHNRAPRNFRRLDDPSHTAEGHNPLCGDRVSVSLKMDGDRIADAAFQGSGCAISRASASLMTSAVQGKSTLEAEELFERFHRLVTGSLSPHDADALGKLAVFSGVAAFPVRVKCASLPWHTMKAALRSPAAPMEGSPAGSPLKES